MWHLGTWFNGGLGNAGLMVVFSLKGLFQHKRFYDSNSILTDVSLFISTEGSPVKQAK